MRDTPPHYGRNLVPMHCPHPGCPQLVGPFGPQQHAQWCKFGPHFTGPHSVEMYTAWRPFGHAFTCLGASKVCNRPLKKLKRDGDEKQSSLREFFSTLVEPWLPPRGERERGLASGDEVIDADNNDNADFDDEEEGQEEHELLGVGNELGLRPLVNEHGLLFGMDKGV